MPKPTKPDSLKARLLAEYIRRFASVPPAGLATAEDLKWALSNDQKLVVEVSTAN